MSMSLLTKNAIPRILSGENIPYPRLQVLGYKKFASDTKTGNNTPKYRFLLSDGSATHQFCAMVGETLITRVERGEFEKFTVIELCKYVMNCLQERKVIIIMEPRIVKKGSDVQERICQPINSTQVDTSEIDSRHLLAAPSTVDCTVEEENDLINDDTSDSESVVDIPRRRNKRTKSFFDSEAELSGSEASSDEADDVDGQSLSSTQQKENDFINDDTSDSESATDDNDGRGNIDIKSFFDNEAEFSGSEASSDEAEDEEDDIVQQDPEEELPSEDELRNEVGKIFFKQEMDEDKRRLLQFQEQFLEDGDLHGDGKVRERKFRWKNIDNTAWQNIADSDASESDDDTPKPTFNLKPLNEVKQKLNIVETESTVTSNVLRRRMFGGPSGNITSYIIRDEKLKSALSVTHKRNSPFRNKQTKRLKSARKENKESIFDIFAKL